MPHIMVDIPVDGDWPSPDDMSRISAVIDELDESNFGEFIGAGGGMGAMDFSFEVVDGDAARRIVETALAKHLPGREFTIGID